MDNRIKVNRFGYVIPNPETGKEETYTRATGIAAKQENTYGLNQWQLTQLAWGLVQKPYLIERAQSADGPGDKATLREVVSEALSVADTAEKSMKGSAIHGITQKVDRGDPKPLIPAIHRDRITRYRTLVSAFGFEFIRSLIEATVFMTTPARIAGTIDRVANWAKSELPIIVDLKTGSLDYIKVKTAQQLAIYAHAQYLWDPAAGQAVEAPKFNQQKGLVIWLSATTDDEPKVYEVDLEEGWSLAKRSLDISETQRSKGKHLFTEIKADAQPTQEANREEMLRERVKQLVAAGQSAALLSRWDSEVPTLKEGGLTDTQLDLVEGWCDEVESAA